MSLPLGYVLHANDHVSSTYPQHFVSTKHAPSQLYQHHPRSERTIVLAGHRTKLRLILFINGVLIVKTKRQNRTKPRSSTDGYLDIANAAIIFGLMC
jgi:hypothetical protein